ncbi:MAG: LysR family transcriptional regulator [Eubacteriales bacterium]|nr:LysR family transcriptional regulator [Eubacteriales bacterium]
MNLNQLEYFVAAAETLNFTKAAQKCFISQTAMTLQIRALEETVGVPLFIRDKRHVSLTNAGQVYLKEARQILKKSSDAIRLARTASEGIEGSLTIGFIKGYGHDLMDALRKFHLAYPQITLHFVTDNRRGLFEKLEKGEIDAVFSIAGYHRLFNDIEHRYLKSFPLMAAVYPGHPLSDQTYITYPDLEHEDFIIMQPAGYSKDEMDESILIYERGGYFPNIVALEKDHETLLLMVSTGMGIAILPEYITRLYQKNPNLRLLPVVTRDGTAETMDFEICWLTNRRNPSVDHLLETITDY